MLTTKLNPVSFKVSLLNTNVRKC